MIWTRNPLDVLLKKAAKKGDKKFLITWNRGLGDIALGLYALVRQVRAFIPDAEITFVTRKDLAMGFSLLKDVHVIIGEEWRRGVPFDLDATLEELELSRSQYDVVIENPNVTKWLSWQLGKLTPRLQWKEEWDELWKRFGLSTDGTYIAVHVQTETQYPYEKNWPAAYWTELFKRLQIERCARIILFGLGKSVGFPVEGLIDLRGSTTLLEMLSILKNRCNFLVAPDSGVLSLAYFLDASFPLKVISLWADPKQGVLKQNVVSPNPELVHAPLIGKKGDISLITVEQVCSIFNEQLSFSAF